MKNVEYTPPSLQQLYTGNDFVHDFDVSPRDPNDWFTVPILINSYNRVSYLQGLVARLKELGYENIYIIDNNSTYRPLLDYYSENKLRVFYLSENVGYLSLWQTKVFEFFRSDFYVYTDSDVIPHENCPCDFIQTFATVLQQNPLVQKAGFSLCLDKIPDANPDKTRILEWEKQFWRIKNQEFNAYIASIDTTFALYRPSAFGGWWVPSVRVGSPYLAHHMPWYEDPNNLTEDDHFYYRSITKETHWSKQDHGKIKALGLYLKKRFF